ncbi:HEAT repeat domain-containing protein [Kitasatospora sp. NPDC091335]|uniref:HEAT repeat domain-containing protein n=1 Tax=Kitasatospora sp. NPDC091335 TaxID=3364085 RepID=UPI00380D8CE5
MLLARIAAAGDPGDPAELRAALYWLRVLRRGRRGPVDHLARLAAHPDPEVREDLVLTVGRWSIPGVAELLTALADDPAPDVREAVAEVLAPEALTP